MLVGGGHAVQGLPDVAVAAVEIVRLEVTLFQQLGEIRRFQKPTQPLHMADDELVLSLIHISEPTRPY